MRPAKLGLAVNTLEIVADEKASFPFAERAVKHSTRRPHSRIRTAIDDTPANSVADLDELPGCPGCGKKVRVVIEYVEAPVPH